MLLHDYDDELAQIVKRGEIAGTFSRRCSTVKIGDNWAIRSSTCENLSLNERVAVANELGFGEDRLYKIIHDGMGELRQELLRRNIMALIIHV
ncbi:hypothetical protein [Natronoarchaeum rubrum]|uniref:hypothetical protein n=1 Tax=Natronoarchaeum rubrum TaxID=755311 RepID=UPI002111BDA7|nr:hypothetical protein [Natronoarchaeum rubrum]